MNHQARLRRGRIAGVMRAGDHCDYQSMLSLEWKKASACAAEEQRRANNRRNQARNRAYKTRITLLRAARSAKIPFNITETLMLRFAMVFLVAVLSTGAVQAHGHGDDSHDQETEASSSDANSSSYSQVTSSNTATGGTASNAGNTQSTTIAGSKNPVNTAVAGIGETTAACRYHNGGGLQVAGVGFSLGRSRKDEDCERIAIAQILWTRGQDIAGDRIMCQVTTVAKALGEDCLALVHELKPAAITEAHNEYVTPAQLGEVEKRIIEKVATK